MLEQRSGILTSILTFPCPHLYREAFKQRVYGTQARGSGENDNNKAHKEYIKHMFPDSHPETLLTAPAAAALKKELQFARRWAIWVEGYVDKKDGLVPGLGSELVCSLDWRSRRECADGSNQELIK